MWREFVGPTDHDWPGDDAGSTRACFLVDASFPAQAIELLRSAGARVSTTAEPGLAEPQAQAAFARHRPLALLTCDAGLLDAQRFPAPEGPAIFVFHFGNGSINDMRRALRCLAPVLGGRGFGAHCRVEANCTGWIEHGVRADGTPMRRSHRLWHGKLQEWVDEACGATG